MYLLRDDDDESCVKKSKLNGSTWKQRWNGTKSNFICNASYTFIQKESNWSLDKGEKCMR